MRRRTLNSRKLWVNDIAYAESCMDEQVPGPRPGRQPLTARRLLAEQLQHHREKSGWSLSSLANKAHYDRSDLHKMELGQKLGPEHLVAKLDGLYGTGNTLTLLWRLAKEEHVRDTYRAYMEMEASATVLHQYATSTVPGLLQTESYARTLVNTWPIWSQEEVETELTKRMARQERLGEDGALHYRAILDEACFRRVPRTPQTWRDQLTHLAEMADRPNVTLQVLPFASGLHELAGANLSLLWQADGANAAYQESSHTATVVADAKEVANLRLSYDALRDSALTPSESRTYIQRAVEEHTPCTLPDRT
ncbi:helix-turn-helix domain-containing protein [Streptomyces sp. NBC_01795]|uniref:helix-turn-helix domain-containing protein n=1 Tax=unclassified Streptomyces TaxID=2593676 RepID=UPI002DDBAA7F|nr:MULTISPECIES: helix-turn-helix transcriptional regulator [unclassified Streptomyces]WSA93099.1 helix-turn-helix domain-containing protein [Streptomyces sp. NBC_01795]WSB77468.1 helix-turn-helix domain-containing protein [Streptomyces sp. NBC_01775]